MEILAQTFGSVPCRVELAGGAGEPAGAAGGELVRQQELRGGLVLQVPDILFEYYLPLPPWDVARIA